MQVSSGMTERISPNVGRVKPMVIGRAIPTAPDLIWPSQLAIHHESHTSQ